VCSQDAAPCSGELLDAIKAKWGSLDNFTTTFNTTTAAVQVCVELLWKQQLAAGVAQSAS
jgi:superoxide dismutase